MELYFDLNFLAILNLYTVDWETEFVSEKASNTVSVLVVALFNFVLVFYLVGYLCLSSERREQKFGEKFSPLLDGVDFKTEGGLNKEEIEEEHNSPQAEENKLAE